VQRLGSVSLIGPLKKIFRTIYCEAKVSHKPPQPLGKSLGKLYLKSSHGLSTKTFCVNQNVFSVAYF